MMLNFDHLFQLQKKLDERIHRKHDLQNENLIEKKILALFVEIGELANETRCFKFWSTKPASDKEKILEEFIDGLHFILSLGLEFDYASQVNNTKVQPQHSLNDQFLLVFDTVSLFRKTPTLENYQQLFHQYLELGLILGFSEEEVERAYMEKNEVNHHRQTQNY
jgi:dimeric dUTPase (all-alpha-NTP-PPase superfamily)